MDIKLQYQTVSFSFHFYCLFVSFVPCFLTRLPPAKSAVC